MRRMGARLLAFLAVAAASFAIWSGLALAGSSATTSKDTGDAGSGFARTQLIQTQTPGATQTPDAQSTPARHLCPRQQNNGSNTTQTATNAV